MSVKAQNINSVFVEMPDSLSPLLTKVNRQDFADFLSSGMKAVVKNKFGGKSEMLKLTDNYLLLESSSVTKEEMKLLPLNDSVNVLCFVKTYSGPVEDSTVKFYSTDWNELPSNSFILLPQHDDFYKIPSDSIMSINKGDAVQEMFIFHASLSEKNNDLVIKYKTLDVMEKESAERLKPFSVDSITYYWEKGHFIKK